MTNADTQTFTVTILKERFEKLRHLAGLQDISATSALEKTIETEYYARQQVGQGKRILIWSSPEYIQEITF